MTGGDLSFHSCGAAVEVSRSDGGRQGSSSKDPDELGSGPAGLLKGGALGVFDMLASPCPLLPSARLCGYRVSALHRSVIALDGLPACHWSDWSGSQGDTSLQTASSRG